MADQAAGRGSSVVRPVVEDQVRVLLIEDEENLAAGIRFNLEGPRASTSTGCATAGRRWSGFGIRATSS